ncbi:hypothetical protein [Mesobacillus maritimus]|nr:hypothetical protein [Mesobacillus maritimus]
MALFGIVLGVITFSVTMVKKKVEYGNRERVSMPVGEEKSLQW